MGNGSKVSSAHGNHLSLGIAVPILVVAADMELGTAFRHNAMGWCGIFSMLWIVWQLGWWLVFACSGSMRNIIRFWPAALALPTVGAVPLDSGLPGAADVVGE